MRRLPLESIYSDRTTRPTSQRGRIIKPSVLFAVHPMSSNEIEKLERHLSADPRLRQAVVFGSVASGAARVDSDLDIAVDIGRALTADQRLAMMADLAMLSGRPVDLVDLCTVGEPLLGQILRHGQRLLGSNADFGRLIARHLTNRADFLPLLQRIQDHRRHAWIG